MKSKTIILVAVVLLGTFFLTINPWATEEETQVASKVITINAARGLDPATVTSIPGTTIIWVNQSSKPAELRFLDKKVTMACGAPINFIHGKGGYESGKIVEGGVASLCFLEKGSYQYIYKASSTFDEKQEGKEYQGTIIIQ